MISIVIPLLNEEENIHHLYDRLVKSSINWNDTFEIIFVDDGSVDNTFNLLKNISDNDLRVKILKLSRNFGHQAAITAGIKYSKGDAVVIMDGDLQDPPEELNRFLDKWRQGYHVVYAIRKNRKENLFKKISYSTFYKLLSLISDIDIPLDSGDFCVLDRKVVNVLNNTFTENNRFVRGLRAYSGFKQIGVEYDRSARAAGEVKYTFKKLLKLAIDGLLDFSTFPLRISSYLGLFISFSSFIVGLFFILGKLFNFKLFGYPPTNPGIATLAVGVFFLSGVILLTLGIIGEYIGRIYFEVKKRPFYIVDEFIENL